jgi:hypothetical protein
MTPSHLNRKKVGRVEGRKKVGSVEGWKVGRVETLREKRPLKITRFTRNLKK